MRVALLSSAFAPSIGGVRKLTWHLGRRLVAAGDEVEVWTPRLDGDAEVDGLAVRRFHRPLPPARVASPGAFAGKREASTRSTGSVTLATVADVGLVLVERLLTPWSRLRGT